MSSIGYDPSARYEVSISDPVLLQHSSGALEATIYQPRGSGPFPGLLNIHGGAWCRGERSNDHPMIMSLAASGMVVVALEYRLAPQHPYPAQIMDTNLGIRWIKANARDLNIDPGSVGAMGCSSGGHTVMMSGLRPTDPRYNALDFPCGDPVDASVRYLLCCWPVLDPYARYLYARNVADDRLVESTEAYFLNEAAMHEGNPQEILERQEIVELPSTLIIQGTNDGNVPLSIPQKFEASFRQAGGGVELELFPGMPHGFGNQPFPESARALDVMKGFIARQLGTPVPAAA